MNTTPFCKQATNPGTHTPIHIPSPLSKLEQVKKENQLFILGNTHHFSRELGKIFPWPGEGEILQHKAQPRAPQTGLL